MTDHWTDDEPIPEARLLASAYLDGELTADERARSEADPDVQRELAAMRESRRLIAAVEPPDVDRRESAIAAALVAAERPAAPPVVSLASRRGVRWLAPMAAAAAAVVIVVGGVVALRDSSGDDDSGAARVAPAAEEQLSLDAAGTLTPQAAAGTEAAATTAGGGAAATTVPATPAETATEATEGGTFDEALAPLRTEADLRGFAADAVERSSGNTAGEATSCRPEPLLGLARYESPDGTVVDVEVYAIDDPAELIAVDRATCAVVLRAPTP